MARLKWFGNILETYADWMRVMRQEFQPNESKIATPYIFFELLELVFSNKVSYDGDDGATEAMQKVARENIGVDQFVPDGLLVQGDLTFPTTTSAIVTDYTYRLNGITHDTGTQNLTILAPDGTYARVDAISGDAYGNVTYHAGTAAANSPFPTIPQGELLLDSFLVNTDGSIIVNPPPPPATDPFNTIYVTGPGGAQLNSYSMMMEFTPRNNRSYMFQIHVLGESDDYSDPFYSRNGALLVSMTFGNSTTLSSLNIELISIGDHIRSGDFVIHQDTGDNDIIRLYSKRVTPGQRTYYKWGIHNANTPFDAMVTMQNYQSFTPDASTFYFTPFTRIHVGTTPPTDTSLLWYDTN